MSMVRRTKPLSEYSFTIGCHGFNYHRCTGTGQLFPAHTRGRLQLCAASADGEVVSLTEGHVFNLAAPVIGAPVSGGPRVGGGIAT